MSTENPEVTQPPNEDPVKPEVMAAARAADNTWIFEGREIEKFVARGEAQIATRIVEPGTDKDTGAKLIHIYGWQKPDPFVIRENSFKTKLSRVGRRQEQKIDTAHLATVNSTFYQDIIQGGKLVYTKEGQPVEEEKDRGVMVNMAQLYPEAASEAIETWLDAPVIERLNKGFIDFSTMFRAPDAIKILWALGTRDLPIAAGIFTFNPPPPEERARYDDSVQNVETKRQGDVSSTDIEENFSKKMSYGAKFLANVEGISVGEEGVAYDAGKKEQFITLFNPIWFGDIVEEMHATFDFMKGPPKTN